VFEQLLKILPHELDSTALIMISAAAVAGLILWLVGARYSRPILTLVGVAFGTVFGLKLPQWYGWHIEPMATAVALSLVLGLTAYGLHRLWVGAYLGVAWVAWVTLAAWVMLAGAAHWQWPAYDLSQPLPQYLLDLYKSVPDQMHKWFPYLAGTAMLSGLALAILLPRLGTLLLWSTVGFTMLFLSGSTLLIRWDPSLLQRLPTNFRYQAAIVGGAIVVGAMVQWWTAVRAGPKSHQEHESPAQPTELSART